MPRMNWSIIRSNVQQAREELEHLEQLIENPKRRKEIALETALEHAYHHLNCAWHCRRVSMARYRNLSDADFNRWGSFPKDIELPRV